MTLDRSVPSVVLSSGGSADGTTVRAGAHGVAPQGSVVPVSPTMGRAHGSSEAGSGSTAAATPAPARTSLDPRYSPAVLEEDRPTVYELLGHALAPGLAAGLALYEARGGFAGPRCRPCRGGGCYSMSEALSPYCPRCRVEHGRRAMAQAAAR